MESISRIAVTLIFRPGWIALLVLLLLPIVPIAPANAADSDKVTICHVPPGDPVNVQIITVSQAAAEKHIERHGDLIFSEAGELCDGQDNDCDREIDEDFLDLGAACFDGVGACRRDGVRSCGPDGADTVCAAVAGEPTPELCSDGIDNDCDGTTDCGDSDCEFDPTVHDESSQQFVCKTPACGDGFLDAGEECDDPQNECCASCVIDVGAECGTDGNECTLSLCNAAAACETQDTDGAACTGNGVDACSGPDTCAAGVCQDNGPAAEPEVECNGIDDDCDGTVDECPAGQGCNPDTGVCECIPDYPTCEPGTDADCDGIVDTLQSECAGPSDCSQSPCGCLPAGTYGCRGPAGPGNPFVSQGGCTSTFNTCSSGLGSTDGAPGGNKWTQCHDPQQFEQSTTFFQRCP